jgi:hypothetical protein
MRYSVFYKRVIPYLISVGPHKTTIAGKDFSKRWDIINHSAKRRRDGEITKDKH